MSTHHLELNIDNYSFQEILDLFKLSAPVTAQELKRVKIEVSKLHPDKSRLDPNIFIFYRQAYDIVVQSTRVQTADTVAATPNRAVDKTPMVTCTDKRINKAVEAQLKKLDPSELNAKINTTFEAIARKSKSADSWLSDIDAFKPTGPVSAGNINAAFNAMKKKSQAVVVFNDVQTMFSNDMGGVNNYHENDETDDLAYISCDIFSKLKFDDLRKVHRDRPIFASSDENFKESEGNVETAKASRAVTITPLNNPEVLLQRQAQAYNERIIQKEYETKKREAMHAEKNKSFLASFLQLGN